MVHMSNHQEPPVDSWMGWSNGPLGRRHARDRGHGQQRADLVRSRRQLSQRVDEGDRALHAQGTTTTFSTRPRSRIRRRSRRPGRSRCRYNRRLESNAQLLEFKCVEFAEELLYGDLTKKSEVE